MNDRTGSWQPLAAGLPSSRSLSETKAGAPAVTIEKAKLATIRAGLMYGCYRKDDASNEVIFLDAAVAILADYPDDVIMRVTDPRTGLPGKIKWPPQPQEVKAACEEIMQPRRNRAAWDARTTEQLAERAAIDAERASHPSQGGGREFVSYSDELTAAHGRPVGRFERCPPFGPHKASDG